MLGENISKNLTRRMDEVAMFYIALPKDDKYVIVLGQSFGVRSNAAKYAERMGWKDFWIATEEQRAMIEAGTYGEASTSSYVEIVNVENVEVISQPEPDAKPAENEDVLLKKAPRQTRKKWNVGR